MKKLITTDEIRAYKKISNNLRDDVVEEFIYNVENTFALLLGTDLYNKIKDDSNNVLLNGGVYDVDKNLKHLGLKRVFIELVMIQITDFLDIKVTATSNKNKTIQNSVMAQRQALNYKSRNFNDNARLIFVDIIPHIRTLYGSELQFNNVFARFKTKTIDGNSEYRRGSTTQCN